MNPKHLYVDSRMTGFCVYCGSHPQSRDHCPSRVLLDEPYPPNLPVVEACDACNNSFSLDEQYLACLLECVICGSSDPSQVIRPNIRRILAETPALVTLLEKGKHFDGPGNLIWGVDNERVKRVVIKLARGHMAYELSLPKLEPPACVEFFPITLLNEEQRLEFESSDNNSSFWPELGSRAFMRIFSERPQPPFDWIDLQPGRYRYRVSQGDGDFVRIVISEYLGCHVAWD